MRRVYVASSWRNIYQPHVCEELKAWGHHIYDFRNPPNKAGFHWRDVEEDWQNWNMPKYRELLTSSEHAAHGYVADLRGLEWCDTCLLVLPCGRSAHIEAGYAKGRGKCLIIFIPEPIEPDLMYLMADSICLSMEEVLKELP